MEVLQGFMKALFACEDPFLAAGAKALPPDFVPEAAAEPTAFEAEWTKHGDGAEEAPQEELDADEFWRVSSPSKTCEIEDEPEYIVGGQLVAEPLLVSDLARGVLKELELCEAPIVLTSELSIRIVKDNLPPVKLSSPLARRAAAAVAAEEVEEAAEEAADEAADEPADVAFDARAELRALHAILQSGGLPGLRASLRATSAAASAGRLPPKDGCGTKATLTPAEAKQLARPAVPWHVGPRTIGRAT